MVKSGDCNSLTSSADTATITTITTTMHLGSWENTKTGFDNSRSYVPEVRKHHGVVLLYFQLSAT